MLVKMDCANAAGGRYKEGTFEVSTTGDVTVNDVGFKARLLYITHFTSESTSEFSVGEGVYIYDEDLNPNVAQRGIAISNGDYLDRNAIPYTGSYQVLKNVTDDGFVMHINSTAFYGTYKYVAIR